MSADVPDTSRSPLDGVRLVALDLDGTLLPSDKRLTERAVRVTRRLRDAGIDVTLATGKGWNLTRGYALELDLSAPIIALEGAYVAHATAAGATTVRTHTLDAATRTRLHELTDDLDLGWFFTHTGQRTRLHERLAHRRAQIEIWDPFVDTVDEPLHDHPEEPFVVHLVGDPERVDAARGRVVAAALPGVELFHAEFWDGYHQLQVRAAGVGKHSALETTLDHLGVASCELLAAGDWLNDVEMLRMARVGVSFAHAPQRVRDAADIVLDGDSDADAIVRFLDDALDLL